MITFKQLLDEMVARTRPRAQKLLNYVATRQRAVTIPYSYNSQTSRDTQIENMIPVISSSVKFSYLHNGDKVKDYNYARNHGNLQRIPIKDIVTGQETVQKEIVAKKIQGKYRGHNPEHPEAFLIHAPGHELHGKFYMIDGNHRVVGHKLQGRTHVR